MTSIEPAVSPRALWVELTSKCPFDCVFCSRSTVRGNGEHMEMGLFQSILGQLDAPEILRLNYAGESIHYPHFIRALELAAGTGATTELVSASASLPEKQIPGLVQSGLDRLTVSLHTMSEGQFKEIYRYGSLGELRRKIKLLVDCRDGGSRPKLDFAFVAMGRNLDQLDELAAYAETLGVSECFIHPVISRDRTHFPFPDELGRDGHLKSSFKEDLARTLNTIRARHPELNFSLSTTEVGDSGGVELSSTPRHYSAPLPAGARIQTCDQNPWETVHILANGDVVTCEVRDRIVMGNLRTQTLGEIWHGEAYHRFREEFTEGRDPACRACPYKVAYLPVPLKAAISAGSGAHAQLARLASMCE